MLQLAIAHVDAVLHLEGFSNRSGRGVHLQDPSPVVRVNTGQESFIRATESRLFDIENPIKLF